MVVNKSLFKGLGEAVSSHWVVDPTPSGEERKRMAGQLNALLAGVRFSQLIAMNKVRRAI